jgi:hypothetical protein
MLSEHLITGATLLIDLWQKAPGVKLLVTSRERLNLRDEWVVEVEGLEYPQISAVQNLLISPEVSRLRAPSSKSNEFGSQEIGLSAEGAASARE